MKKDIKDYTSFKELVNDFGGEEGFRCWFPLDIYEYGPFGICTTSSLNEPVLIECKLDMEEQELYRLDEGYKVRLIPANKKLEPYVASCLMYQADLLHSIQSDDFCWIKADGDKVEYIEWEEPVCSNVRIRRHAQVITKG